MIYSVIGADSSFMQPLVISQQEFLKAVCIPDLVLQWTF